MSEPQSELRDFADQFQYDLAAVYDMEVKLVDALDAQSRMAANDNLSKGFAIHRTETETQVRRVERVFEALGREPSRRGNPVVDGLLAETALFEDSVTDDDLLDLHYLVAATATERLEISSYEDLLLLAEKAGFGDDVIEPLADNLEQERKTFRKLRGLAGASDIGTLWKKVTRSRGN